MRRLLPAFLLLIALPAAAAVKWNDAIRDVYVNGALTRDGQTLTHEHQLAYLPPSGDAWIFDRDTHEVVSADRALFTFNDDRTSATTPDAPATQPVGAFAMPDESSYLFRNLLIYPHQSFAGPMTEAALWTTAPIWKSIHDHYAPDAAVVARLRTATPARVTIVFATWCGDSKRAVPRLLKALHEASNPLLQVELVGIGPDFLTPLQTVRERRLTNVPTMIVERGGKEIGRVVETPATATVEQDIALILDGQPLPPHRGRYERKALLASGHYEHRGARGEKATETWELYETKDDGLLVHSLIVPAKEPGRTIDTFAALDAHRMPDFIEVTRRDGDHVVRTRASAEHGKWTVRARGDERGLTEQTLLAPRTLVLPATLTFGWPLFAGERDVDAFVLDDRGPIGAIEKVRVVTAGAGIIPLRKAHRPEFRVAGDSLRYVVSTDSALHVPVTVKLEDGSERRLLDMKGTLPRAVPVGTTITGAPAGREAFRLARRRDAAGPAGETPALRDAAAVPVTG